MKNADMAAMPGITIRESDGFGQGPIKVYNRGLTKREYFAGLAMQAIIGLDKRYSPDCVAEDAVAYAEALCRRLDENN